MKLTDYKIEEMKRTHTSNYILEKELEEMYGVRNDKIVYKNMYKDLNKRAEILLCENLKNQLYISLANEFLSTIMSRGLKLSIDIGSRNNKKIIHNVLITSFDLSKATIYYEENGSLKEYIVKIRKTRRGECRKKIYISYLLGQIKLVRNPFLESTFEDFVNRVTCYLRGKADQDY
jgi:hypothetical protein